jgi:hypothetical protein
MPALTTTGLDKIYENIRTPMDTAETDLRTTLGDIPNGGEVTTAQLLKLQWQIARYTVTASVFSAIIKEMGDALKQTANKIG